MAQGRRVRLVIRRIEPLTVLKVAVLFWASIYVILLVAALMLWSAATATGLRENVESFVGDLIAADDFSFKPTQMLRASVAGGALLVALGSFATVMMAVLYNLISDVVGGVAVVFEETAGRSAERRAARKSAKPGKPGKSDKPGTARVPLGKVAARAAAAKEARDGKEMEAAAAAEAADAADAEPAVEAVEAADAEQAVEAAEAEEAQEPADGSERPGSEPERTAPGQR